MELTETCVFHWKMTLNLTGFPNAVVFVIPERLQEMERAMLPVVPMKPTHDKRSRLQVVAPYIKNGTVLFPRTVCEQLLA